MLKFLLITILLFYTIYRIGGFFFRALFKGAYEQQRNFHNQQRQQHYRESHSRSAPNSNVRVEYMPNGDKKDKKGYNGGQYVDYEEVK